MVGRTFLFRDEMKKTSDEADHWLKILAQDAKMIALVTGQHSFLRTADRLETVRCERSRKGRGKYDKTLPEMVATFGEQEEELLAKCAHAIYPTIRVQLLRRAKEAKCVMRHRKTERAVGSRAVRMMQGYLASVRQIASVTRQYLDPSVAERIASVDEIVNALEDWEKAAYVQGELACDEQTVRSLAQDAQQKIDAYRSLLVQFGEAEEKGLLASVVPSGFLVWADSVCLFAQRALSRILRKKDMIDTQEIDEDEMRAENLLPMTILAEEIEETCAAPQEVAKITPAEAKETDLIIVDDPSMEIDGEAVEEASNETKDDPIVVSEDEGSAIERIYAKASDYKGIVAKAIQKKASSALPRRLGNHQ